MNKHVQTVQDSRDESNGQIPPSREWAYDWDVMSIDDETGQEYPYFMVDEYATVGAFNKHGDHSTERRDDDRRIAELLNSNHHIVQREECYASGDYHFVSRVFGPRGVLLKRSIIWDKVH